MFHELEYKYKADNISLTDFQRLMEVPTFQGYSKLDVSSWDTYYTKGPDEFMRFRDSKSTPELTIKRKTVESNNWTRIEIDLPLDASKVNKETVDRFTQLLGYEENFRIYKSCFIYWFPLVNYVYYIVYDAEMKEKGRFIEVELNKGTYDGNFSLDTCAEALLPLGLNPKNRLKKSLYEIFRKI